MPAVRLAALVTAAAALTWPAVAWPWTVNIAASNTQIYLQAGAGAFSGGFFINGGSPSTSSVQNVVSVAPSPASFGTGPLTMTSDSTTQTSFYDGATVCPGAGQLVYIGGFYRGKSNDAASIQLTATSPASLVDASSGRTISFSKIAWTTSVAGTGRSPDSVQMPAGRFVGGTTQTLFTVTKNTWFEDCFKFSYDNDDATLLSGTYTGVVSFTLTVP